MLEEKFEVDNYLKTMAMEVLVGIGIILPSIKQCLCLYTHWRCACAAVVVRCRQYYEHRLVWEDWANKNIYSWAEPKDERPLFYNSVSVPAYKTGMVGYQTWLETFMKEKTASCSLHIKSETDWPLSRQRCLFRTWLWIWLWWLHCQLDQMGWSAC